MFRKSLEMAENTAENTDFLRRVSELPVVQYIFVQSVDVYGKAKEYNSLVKFSLNAAEKTFTVATERAKPVVAKFHLPLNVANTLACKTLDNLEERLPIVTRKPEEIAAQTKKLYEDTVVLPALQKYNNAKQYGLDTVTAVKNYSLQKTNAFLDTKYGHIVMDRFDSLLLVADGFVDEYLPAVKTEEYERDEQKMVGDLETIVKATLLSAKLRKRILVHGMIKFNASKKRIQETLANLHLAVDLLESLKSNAALTRDVASERLILARKRLQKLWADFNAGDPGQMGEKTLEQKIIYLTRSLSTQLLSAYQRMATAAVLLPETMQPVMALTRQYIEDLYTKFSKASSINEVSALAIQQAREGIGALQTITTQLFDAINSKALSWLIPDLEMKHINIFEESVNDINYKRRCLPNIPDDSSSSSEEETVEFVLKPSWMQ